MLLCTLLYSPPPLKKAFNLPSKPPNALSHAWLSHWYTGTAYAAIIVILAFCRPRLDSIFENGRLLDYNFSECNDYRNSLIVL